MTLKLDENLRVTAAALLRARGYDVDTVGDEGLSGHPDDAVWRSSQAEGRFLVTQDLDFSDTRRFAPGTQHGILLVRLPDAEQWRVTDYLAAWFSDPDAQSWARCVVVATPTKVRVLRPAVSDG
jgi:predicted nuclease of predicted toxin-antitoxin system